jgi:hypothetical protein
MIFILSPLPSSMFYFFANGLDLFFFSLESVTLTGNSILSKVPVNNSVWWEVKRLAL